LIVIVSKKETGLWVSEVNLKFCTGVFMKLVYPILHVLHCIEVQMGALF